MYQGSSESESSQLREGLLPGRHVELKAKPKVNNNKNPQTRK